MTVYLSLGSNLGDRLALLQDAVTRLNAEHITVLRLSPLYETEPQNIADQPWFLNQVAECETSLPPPRLLKALHRIEHNGGRIRRAGHRWGPRRIDIDILLYGNQVLRSTHLTVPHPRMLDRRFVLQPLLDLAPHLIHPETHQPLASYLPSVAHQQLQLFIPR